jgi:hypothetical protein
MLSKKIMSRKFTTFVRGGLILCLSILVSVSVHAQRPLGTDVSGWQTNVNWTTVKNAGVVFAWTKATQGTDFNNPYFTSQEAGAKSAGIYIGAYHYATPSVDTNITGAFSADSEAVIWCQRWIGKILTSSITPILLQPSCRSGSMSGATTSRIMRRRAVLLEFGRWFIPALGIPNRASTPD